MTGTSAARSVQSINSSDFKRSLQTSKRTTAKTHRWYFGGLASSGAALFTHPLDLLKVNLQTQQVVSKGVFGMAVHVARTRGIVAFYNGLSASLGRQLTYSTVRFGVYDAVRPRLEARNQGNLPFYQKILLGAFGGLCGGIIGSPFDVINIRMQNDTKLAVKHQRQYKHVFDGFRRIISEEGLFRLWTGCSLNISRAILMTLSQIAFYEQVKQMLLSTRYFKDNVITHISSSIIAGLVATSATQPVDVIKTRMMNAKQGEYKSIMRCIIYTAQTGPLGFFKGYIPAFVRLGPHTVLTFVFMEQLRKLFPVRPS